MKHLLIFFTLLFASYVGAQAVSIPSMVCTAKWHPYGGAISSATKTFNSGYADFTKASVGQHILVSGAGVSGADLRTTIAGYTSSSVVTLSTAASTLVTNAAFVIGASVDDTAALRKTIAAGGRIVLPAGVCPISSTLTINLPDDSSLGMVIEGGGQFASTTLLWIGAAGTSGATGPNIIAVGDGLAVGPGPVKVDGVQFTSLDTAHRAGGGLRWLNGGQDEVTHSWFGDLNDGVSASNNILSRIDFNTFVVNRDGIAFDTGQSGPVNSTVVVSNEFTVCGRYCIENTSSGSGGSNVNWYAFNDFEGQIADATLGMFYSIGTREVFAFNRFEDGVHSAPTYRSATFGSQTRVIGNAFNQIPSADYTIEFLSGGDNFLGENTYNGTSSLGVAEFDAGGAFGSTSFNEELTPAEVGGTFGPYVQFGASGRGLVAGNLTMAVANGASLPTLGDAGIPAAIVVTTCTGLNPKGRATCWKTKTTVGYVALDGTCICN